MTNLIRFIFIYILLAFIGSNIYAQSDSTTFKTEIYNKEYDIFIHLDLNNRQLIAPDHELFGPIAGYLRKSTSSFYWLILDAEICDKKATLQMVNDFGSEDLVATLIQLNDSTYRLTQKKGSAIKVPYKGKWMKIPNTLEFKKR